MAQLHIYLCYEGGLSSGSLTQKAGAAAKKSEVNAIIEAKSESEVTQYLPEVGILCIRPHYEFQLKAFEGVTTPYNIPIVVIPEEIYSVLDGKTLPRLAVDTLEKCKV